jgi:membrane protein DedA with SNARE-associated domain
VLGLLSSTGFITSAGYGAIFILCVAQSCCIPTSSELTLGFAGVLAATGRMSLPGAIAVGVAGEVVGAYIAWAIGRSAGRAIVDRYGRFILLSHHDLDRAEAWYDRHERFGVFGGRLLPVIRNFVALPAGVAEVPPLRFGLLTAAGSLIWDAAMAGIGYGVGSHWHAIIHAFSDAGYLLGGLAVVAILAALAHRWTSYHRQITAGETGGPRPAGRVGTEQSPSSPPGSGRIVGATAPGGVPAVVSPRDEIVALVRRLSAPGRAEVEKTGASANERLTGLAAAILFILLAAEGATIPKIGSFIALHVIIGLILIPPVLVKLGSTSWRFMRYYTGHPDYVAKGPPQMLLRVLAPFLVATTVVLFASGVALVVIHDPPGWLYVVHRYDFVAWFVILAVHVLAYVWRVPGLIRPELTNSSHLRRRQLPHRWVRVWLASGSIVAGVALALAVWPSISAHVHTFFR